jgi:hypothetical protein
MENIHYSCTIPVAYKVDVCVVGAGPAGCAAATCAAEQGAKVLLIESSAAAGGMSTAARVPMFMTVATAGKLLCEGYGRRILTNLKKMSLDIGYDCGHKINAEHLRFLYEQILEEAKVKLLYYTTLVSTVTENGTIKQAIFTAPSGLFAVDAKVFIDATGDGALAIRSGADYENAANTGEIMPATLCSVWAGVDLETYKNGGCQSHNDEKMPALLEEAFKSGLLPMEDYHHTGVFAVSPNIMVGNFSHVFDIDATNEESLTKGICLNRKLLRAYEKFYRLYVPGFSNAEIVGSGSLLGVRESCRVLGDYQLTKEDYKLRRHFDDDIGEYNFPADLHPPRPGKEEILEHIRIYRKERYAPGETYGIPYRILLPKKLNNVLTCGRCVSVDRYVHASIRVIPACYITGQAAGIAAAMAANQNITPRNISVKDLQTAIPKSMEY